jgi:broad specificity phosphatase PhoE
MPREVADEIHAHLRDEMIARIDALAGRVTELEDDADVRRQRQWTLILAALTGLALPLIVTAVLALLSLRGGR